MEMLNIHNTVEDLVFAEVEEIFNSIEESGNPDQICTCQQCRIDTACFVLNRTKPRYIISNRGVARTETQPFEQQQKEADIITLVHEGIRQVNHNQRPFFSHKDSSENAVSFEKPVFNIPTIIGRLFNGLNFAPMADITIELRHEGKLVEMKDQNWQNPYHLVSNIEGTYTFWSSPIPAEAAGIYRIFEFAIQIEAPDFERVHHVFNIPVLSELKAVGSFSLGRTFKLPDLFMFPPGGEGEDNLAG
ncbi:MAG: late competence development ComFB family protein [Treponema sp.]|jgi:competence protein ComFB|nr:late competence development ComFB family protein [Treponema sp.]